MLELGYFNNNLSQNNDNICNQIGQKFKAVQNRKTSHSYVMVWKLVMNQDQEPISQEVDFVKGRPKPAVINQYKRRAKKNREKGIFGNDLVNKEGAYGLDSSAYQGVGYVDT